MDKNQAEDLVYGQLKELMLPSGFMVKIREQNGNDDDIISNQATSSDLSNFNIFLSSLIIWTDLPFAVNNKLTAELIKKLLLRDKYFILFASRCHSMGNLVKFDYDWGKTEGGKLTYTEDVSRYLWDYSKPMPEVTSDDFFEYRIKPYEVENPYGLQERTLEGGKKVRFRLMDGHSESWLMGLPIDQQTKNTEIRARGLELLVESKWEKVENFMYFSKKEMSSLRNVMKEVDTQFSGLTDLENPATGQTIKYPIISVQDFFYPEEI